MARPVFAHLPLTDSRCHLAVQCNAFFLGLLPHSPLCLHCSLFVVVGAVVVVVVVAGLLGLSETLSRNDLVYHNFDLSVPSPDNSHCVLGWVKPLPQFLQFGMCCLLPADCPWIGLCTAPIGSILIVEVLSSSIALRAAIRDFWPEISELFYFDFTNFAMDFWFSSPLSLVSAVCFLHPFRLPRRTFLQFEWSYWSSIRPPTPIEQWKKEFTLALYAKTMMASSRIVPYLTSPSLHDVPFRQLFVAPSMILLTAPCNGLTNSIDVRQFKVQF